MNTLDPKPTPRVAEPPTTPAAKKANDKIRCSAHINPDPCAPLDPLVVYRAGDPNPAGIHTTYRLSGGEGGDSAFHCIIPFRKEQGSHKGATNEALLAVVIDRLQSAQAGSCACPENDAAIRSLLVAMASLHARTMRRCAEGTIGKQEEKGYEPAIEEVVPVEAPEGAAGENAQGDVDPAKASEGEADPAATDTESTPAEEVKEPEAKEPVVSDPVPAKEPEHKKNPSPHHKPKK